MTRPPGQSDKTLNTGIVKKDEKSENEKYVFNYDGVLGPDSNQEDVWESLNMDAVMDEVIEGYHATIFAYGQTGSGKTYSMEGLTYENKNNNSSMNT